MRLRPPVFAAVYLLAAWLVHTQLPGWRVDAPFRRPVGAVAASAGLALGAWSLLHFRRRRTTYEPFETPSALVTGGPYRVTRNPMYVGITLVLVGVAAGAGSVQLLLAPMAFVVTMNARQIPDEEAVLQRLFGATYDAYCRRVRRWL